MICNFYHLRFFSPERALTNHSRLRWSALNVHQLDTVIERFRIDNVLESVYDNRLSRIENLGKAQLIEECKKCGVKFSGVKHQLVERLFRVYGHNHMVILTNI